MMINMKGKLIHILERKLENRVEQWNFPIWDIHCHILPEVDDGACSIQDALKMIEQEISEGVNKVILTPHYITGKTDAKLIKRQFQKLEYIVSEMEYPIKLYLGNELLYSIDIIEELQSGRALTLADSSYILVEFPIGTTFQWMKHAFQELQLAGYRPILAHMERFECVWYYEDRIEELINLGVYIQVNSNSFMRKDMNKRLMKTMKEGKIHFIGTDSHSPDWRLPKMQETICMMKKSIEKEDMIRVFVENPNKLLINRYI